MSGVVPRWEHFRHGADIGIRGVARSRDEAFEQIALALSAVISRLDDIRPLKEVLIAERFKESDDTLLLYDWLNAIILQSALQRLIFRNYKVCTRDDGLWGWGTGELMDEERHDLACEVKGATMTEISSGFTADGNYVAQCVVDV